ncbi:MAG: hypothetical protein A2W01_07195 [Candidatus Solincola sediminis]|nr:MAG: hypothetical protein A2W01_07195 [Candidatus Solincola sediminis]
MYFLFYVDGTLVDNNDAHAKAWVEAFVRNGFETTYGDVRKLIGMGSCKTLTRYYLRDPGEFRAG